MIWIGLDWIGLGWVGLGWVGFLDLTKYTKWSITILDHI